MSDFSDMSMPFRFKGGETEYRIASLEKEKAQLIAEKNSLDDKLSEIRARGGDTSFETGLSARRKSAEESDRQRSESQELERTAKAQQSQQQLEDLETQLYAIQRLMGNPSISDNEMAGYRNQYDALLKKRARLLGDGARSDSDFEPLQAGPKDGQGMESKEEIKAALASLKSKGMPVDGVVYPKEADVRSLMSQIEEFASSHNGLDEEMSKIYSDLDSALKTKSTYEGRKRSKEESAAKKQKRRQDAAAAYGHLSARLQKKAIKDGKFTTPEGFAYTLDDGVWE